MEINTIYNFDSRRSEPSIQTKGNYWRSLILSCSIEHQKISDQRLRAYIREKAEQEDYREAITLLNQLINRHPKSAIDYNNRGLMHCKQGNFLRAMEDFEQAIILNPYLDQAYNNRGNCNADLGYLAKALEDYQICLDLNPYNQKAWINKGITLRELKRHDLALETFDFSLVIVKALKGRVYGERGYTYHLRGDWNCATADYRRALSELLTGDPYISKVQRRLSELLNF
ncbi:MAG: tetratricopeptide repeat protein [cyanobacterium endosymbiont of Rhopalodia sterrenbergii]